MIPLMKKRLDRSLSGVLIYQFYEFWPYYIGAFFCLWATHTIQSYLPFKAKELADMVETGSQNIDTAIFFYFAIGIIVFRTASRLLFFYPARVQQKYFRVEMLSRLENATPLRYKDYSSGQLFQVLFNDLEQLRALVGFALLQVGNIIIAVAVLAPKIAEFEPQLLYALIPMVISFLFFSITVATTKDLYRQNQDMQGEVQNFIMESYAGKKTIKNFHAEPSFIQLFKEYSFRELMFFYRAGHRVAVSLPLVPLGVGLSFVWGALIIKEHDLGASSLILFSGFVFLFLEPLMFLSWIGVVFTRSWASWQRIEELVRKLRSPADHETKLLAQNQHLLGQEKKSFWLEFWSNELDIEIHQRSLNVLVGKTGHGKTHLLMQMAEIYRSLDEEISYVAQDPYLYNDTIQANLFLGRDPSLEELEEAYRLLRLFGLDYLTSTREELMSLEVGEHGKRLSGGQAKRVALVRSLLSEAKVLLWDDPFSSVDVILERSIMKELIQKNYFSDRTIILTSHRLTTVKLSEYVVYLDQDDGIVESGKVQSLLDRRGALYAYFENQLV
jgi:ABC-type multidrug transport system fused ATPase/permease subunit